MVQGASFQHLFTYIYLDRDSYVDHWRGSSIKKLDFAALAGVAQWIERWPVNQRVTGSIPSQGTCLDCGPDP